ncbi:uncharacterized protein AAGF69_003821 isoform 2-T10 [Amazona ochrocephala]
MSKIGVGGGATGSGTGPRLGAGRLERCDAQISSPFTKVTREAVSLGTGARNFPGTASCDRTRSGASTATRGQPRADAPRAAAPCHAGASGLLKPSPPTSRSPRAQPSAQRGAADARRTRDGGEEEGLFSCRCLPVMLPIESGMAGGSASFPVEHVTAGICCRSVKWGISELD